MSRGAYNLPRLTINWMLVDRYFNQPHSLSQIQVLAPAYRVSCLIRVESRNFWRTIFPVIGGVGSFLYSMKFTNSALYWISNRYRDIWMP